ncbi:MFS transporter [Jiella endophytica]|uniref:MFS transporter n=1 Tax=Jiella endophytica TaxID=2558362 RepID=A0A4Y8RTA9_9HYPH|nr:MFS transporter [Jiella endophytica]TFF27535.1 MFS transporter [Jiella endophytica]
MNRVELNTSGGRQSWVTAALALAMLLASLGTSIANIALPALAEAFSAPFSTVQAVVVAYLAAMTVAVVFAGRLGDRLGLKPGLVAGLCLFLTASLGCGAAPTLWLLVGARAVQGVGAAFLMTLSMALMRQCAGVRLGRAMGLLGTASALGTALGPSLGGLLVPAFGWRGVFLVQVPLAAIALVLTVAVLPAGAARRKAAAPGGWQAPNGDLAGGLAGCLALNLVVAAVMMTTLVVGPFYLQLGLGLQPASIGLVMAIGPAISIVSGVPSGRLVDAKGSRRVLLSGLSCLACGAVLLALLPNAIGVAGYMLSIAVLTPGYQLFQAANNTAALEPAPKERHGRISGLLNLSRNIGLIAGASLMSAVFAFGVGSKDFVHATPVAIAGGMRLTFLLAGAMIVAAIGAQLWSRHRLKALAARAVGAAALQDDAAETGRIRPLDSAGRYRTK